MFEQDGADQSDDAGLIGEDTDDIGASFDFFIEALEWVGAVQFGAVLGREGQAGGIDAAVLVTGTITWRPRTQVPPPTRLA